MFRNNFPVLLKRLDGFFDRNERRRRFCEMQRIAEDSTANVLTLELVRGNIIDAVEAIASEIENSLKVILSTGNGMVQKSGKATKNV